MNLVSMAIINPQKDYWQIGGSNQRPPVLTSCMLSTELRDCEEEAEEEEEDAEDYTNFEKKKIETFLT